VSGAHAAGERRKKEDAMARTQAERLGEKTTERQFLYEIARQVRRGAGAERDVLSKGHREWLATRRNKIGATRPLPAASMTLCRKPSTTKRLE
jgi:hypothetical protein